MENIKMFFERHNLNIIIQDSSGKFGDKFKVFSDNNIAFRISSTRSLNSIDVCSHKDWCNWFDLALLKAFLNKETNLNKPMKFEDYLCFLNKEIDIIKKMFAYENYPSTKLNLQKLEKERIKQMFPIIKQ